MNPAQTKVICSALANTVPCMCLPGQIPSGQMSLGLPQFEDIYPNAPRRAGRVGVEEIRKRKITPYRISAKPFLPSGAR